MKSLKAVEVRQMNETEIINRLMEEENNLMNLRFQLASSQLTNTSQIERVKREIARLKTVLTEKTKSGGEKA
jgi:large subunit ribosomal protein L29